MNTTVDTFLRQATDELRGAGIASARLDALVLLADVLQRDKAWLIAHGDENVPPELIDNLWSQVNRRKTREPLSYIRGKQEFFGRAFTVNPSVLIPRPETETLIELLLALELPREGSLVDVGTGSGVIAITAKCERPDLHVYGLDVSEEALSVARTNAANLHADIALIQSNLLQNAPSTPAFAIVANLPYVDINWQRSPETNFEPEVALFAEDGGKALILELIEQSTTHLRKGGYLLLEADPVQHESITLFAGHRGFSLHASQDYALVFTRS